MCPVTREFHLEISKKERKAGGYERVLHHGRLSEESWRTFELDGSELRQA